MLGGLSTFIGLMGRVTLSDEWLRTIGLIGVITLLGAGLAAAMINKKEVTQPPVRFPQNLPLLVICGVGALVAWAAMEARLKRRTGGRDNSDGNA